jgi:hypothetical protein
LKLPNHLYAEFLTLLCSVFAFTVWGLKRCGKFISRLFKKNLEHFSFTVISFDKFSGAR